MIKKILIILFVSILIIILLDFLLHYFSVFQKYITTVLLLILGTIIYPLNFKFEGTDDFMIFPIIAVLLFNILNLFFLNDYSLKIQYFNLTLGLFSLFQHFKVLNR